MRWIRLLTAAVLLGAGLALGFSAGPTWAIPVSATACASPGAIVGTEGSDYLVGTSGPDIICGLGGNDYIDGLGGNDILIGGAGDDQIFGRAGQDAIIGDEIFAPGPIGPGTTPGVCSGGQDYLDGGNDRDDITGDCRSDQRDIVGTNGNDTIVGGQDAVGDEFLVGDSRTFGSTPAGGNDFITGSRGNDTIYGDNLSSGGTAGPGGNDTIDARAGSDFADADGGFDHCQNVEARQGCETFS